jgi:hypothetical protein
MDFMGSYKGKPYRDDRWSAGSQAIPGRVFCAYYDLGGEGIAYHDHDAVNQGSGGLNPLDGTYLNEFRKDEGVDTSYVKFRDSIDNNGFNVVEPEKDMLYVGWTEPDEWVRYTVSIAAAGEYSVSLMFTSHAGGRISLAIDAGNPVCFDVPSTFDERDPLEWRQWHHWNKTELGVLALPQGTHVLTLQTVEKGNMNYAYLEFTPR